MAHRKEVNQKSAQFCIHQDWEASLALLFLPAGAFISWNPKRTVFGFWIALL